jgi:hypothetical protein
LVVALDVVNTAKNQQISLIQGQFSIGANLSTKLAVAPVYTNTNTTFPSADYTITTGLVGTISYFKFEIDVDSVFKTLTKNVWYELGTYTYTYQQTPGLHTSFSWSDSLDTYLWSAIIYISSLDMDFGQTGQRASVPADLADVSLPVQLTEFIAAYSYDRGVTLNWTTQSEVNSAGFHILRAENPDGEFERVTREMIPGQGNSSSLTQYSFSDAHVGWEKTYYYKIHEISTLYMDTSRTYSGTISVQTDRAPKTFALSQNYPNPFNPGTEIGYEITDPSLVTLKIYNLLGKEVRTLLNEQKPAGVYQVKWDGKDDKGFVMPSGVYIYRIIAGDRSEIRKMTKMQ